MFIKNQSIVEEYNKEMAEIKEANRNVIVKDYLTRLHLYMSRSNIDSGFVDMEIDLDKNPIKHQPDYFSEDKIVVYTVIFGDYDSLLEPLTVPDNCEFYVITDQEVAEESVWKRLEVNPCNYDLADKSGKEKNDFFRMHPHLFFEDYKYSLYIDGNVRLMTDPTEFIDSMNQYGFIAHNHYRCTDVFVEIERCRDQELVDDEFLDNQIDYLIGEDMPQHYGMIEANILFREHNNPHCKTLMEEWWEEFDQHDAKRDQLYLPLVLYRHGIKTAEIATMGNDQYSNYAFQHVHHKKDPEPFKYQGNIGT